MTANVGANRPAAHNTIARRQTRTRRSTPYWSQSVEEVDPDAELVTAANPQTQPATQITEAYVTRAFAEAEREAAAERLFAEAEREAETERQEHQERFMEVRYPTPWTANSDPATNQTSARNDYSRRSNSHTCAEHSRETPNTGTDTTICTLLESKC